MPARIDLRGKTFGEWHIPLTARYELGKWKCTCSCGVEKFVNAQVLREGVSKSCGHAHNHGLCGTPEYTAWVNMKQRCYGYGGIGHVGYEHVSVCPEWMHDPKAFCDHIGPRPSPLHSVDRHPIFDGDYTPGNVRWATDQEQAANRSQCHMVEIDGRTQTVTEWSRELGVNPGTALSRINQSGRTPLESVTLPTHKGRRDYG